jgi:hypothetical protein
MSGRDGGDDQYQHLDAAELMGCSATLGMMGAGKRVSPGCVQRFEANHMATWAPRVALLLPLLFGGTALAGENGTRDEAKAMAIRASDLFRNEGPEKAFREFDNGAAFHDRDLYVIVYDQGGKCLAHGANPVLIGKSLIDLKDSDGASVV